MCDIKLVYGRKALKDLDKRDNGQTYGRSRGHINEYVMAPRTPLAERRQIGHWHCEYNAHTRDMRDVPLLSVAKPGTFSSSFMATELEKRRALPSQPIRCTNLSRTCGRAAAAPAAAAMSARKNAAYARTLSVLEQSCDSPTYTTVAMQSSCRRCNQKGEMSATCKSIMTEYNECIVGRIMQKLVALCLQQQQQQ